MTGRQLYNRLCEAVEDGNVTPPGPLHWEFLTPAEKRVWDRIAEDAGK